MHLAIWIADQPCLMPVSVQPIDFETGAVLLAAPAAAALDVENVHVKSAAGRRCGNLSSRAAFFENVIVNCIYCLERFTRHF